MHTIIFKKSYLILIFASIIVLSSIIFIPRMVSSTSPKPKITIVIDAGHGGRDNGCCGTTTGVTEKEINLAIAKKLEKQLKDFGFNVVLTRTSDDGLYNANATNFKTSDMEKRIEIIEKAKPDFVISIHQNSYPNAHEYGAQAFWQDGDEDSRHLAEAIQSCLVAQIDNARDQANYGDYYILNQSPCSAVIVECGYLTNEAEEMLLQDESYQSNIAYAITCGIIKYFECQ